MSEGYSSHSVESIDEHTWPTPSSWSGLQHGWACSSWLCTWWFKLLLTHMCLPRVPPPLNRSVLNTWWCYQGTQCCKWLSKVCAKGAFHKLSAPGTRKCNQHSNLPRRSHAWRQHITYLSHPSIAQELPVTLDTTSHWFVLDLPVKNHQGQLPKLS
jgi:hypothetical protein